MARSAQALKTATPRSLAMSREPMATTGQHQPRVAQIR